MKNITPNLVKFAVTAGILVVTFRYFLTYGIENKSNAVIILSALSYSFAMFLTGRTFGKKDREYLPIYDIGFRFHFATYLVHNILSELWFLSGYNSPLESVAAVHFTALIWGIFLLLHFIFYLRTRKNSIHNLDRENLFD